MLTRRQLLQGMCMLPFAGMVVAPRFLWADSASDSRLVVIILRGAMDGLAAVPPIGDSAFSGVRGALANNAANAFRLNSYFGLDANMPTLAALYQQQQMTVFHAAALPYRERSHFDAQNMLESGRGKAGLYDSGWLNRSLASLGGNQSHPLGLALMSAVPLILRGKAPVTSWMPNKLPSPNDDLIGRISMMYKGDELLEPIITAAAGTNAETMGMKGGGNQGAAMAAMTAKLLMDADGPRVAVMDLGGFDSHAGQAQANGRLARAFKELDDTVKALAQNLAPVWDKTSILVMTEFGRTVAMNGTNGTDHGTATAAFLLGGKVNGGRVLADWPGLGQSQLHEGRDLRPTMNLHSVMKGVLAGSFRLDPGYIDRQVFPESVTSPALTNLYKS